MANPAEVRRRLLEKQSELVSEIARLENEARDNAQPEVRDPIDEATANVAEAESLEESTRLSETLRDVQDALRRLDQGTYGICDACGNPIEPARLEAVPWARFCLRDQAEHERRGR